MIDKNSSKLFLELAIGLPVMTLLAAAFAWMTGAAWTVTCMAVGLYALLASGLARLGSTELQYLGWPNRITVLRAMLVALLTAALIEPILYLEAGWLIAALALVALVLDGLDGWMARTLNQETSFGARFDMEVDAALILVLCLGLALSGKVGAWVLAIGLMRYAFLAAMLILPWLARPLPSSFRRKLVCVWQVVSLVLAATPLFDPLVNALILASALALLIHSFAVDTAWLYRQHVSKTNPSWRMS